MKSMWQRGKPDRRMFALVLWDEATHPIPVVAQYDPKLGTWSSMDGEETGPSTVCSYAPLPDHASFSSKTHYTMSVYAEERLREYDNQD